MNFCSHCGASVTLRVPAHDNRPRYVCNQCHTIHYQNPRMVVGAIAEWEGKILLCRRAIEPRLGFWTLPAGFMENHETVAAAAARETLEEAEAQIEPLELFSLVNVPHINQVHLFYRARLISAEFAPGTESLDVALFATEEIPWHALAFRSVEFSLRRYLSDRTQGSFTLHTLDLGAGETGHALSTPFLTPPVV
jgi:ADP-ribose pyrophosphatase YjhB (NUDIX family)